MAFIAIKSKAIINESATEKLIRELRAEIARLKELLAKGGAGGLGSNSQELVELQAKFENELEFFRSGYEQAQTARDNARRELEVQRDTKEKQKKMPHLWNISEDPALTGMLLYPIPKQDKSTTFGLEQENDVVLEGPNIFGFHAEFTNTDNKHIWLRNLNK